VQQLLVDETKLETTVPGIQVDAHPLLMPAVPLLNFFKTQ